jgi:hypothetical protein
MSTEISNRFISEKGILERIDKKSFFAGRDEAAPVACEAHIAPPTLALFVIPSGVEESLTIFWEPF